MNNELTLEALERAIDEVKNASNGRPTLMYMTRDAAWAISMFQAVSIPYRRPRGSRHQRRLTRVRRIQAMRRRIAAWTAAHPRPVGAARLEVIALEGA